LWLRRVRAANAGEGRGRVGLTSLATDRRLPWSVDRFTKSLVITAPSMWSKTEMGERSTVFGR